MAREPSALGRIVFAARVATAETVRAVERRAESLTEFYRPLGEPSLRLHRRPELAFVYGEIIIGEAPPPREDLICWGGTLPAGLRGADELVGASDGELRSFDTALGAIAATSEVACVVTGSAPGPCFYTARSQDAEVWATHAIAAAVLAGDEPRLDPSGLSDYITIGAVAGDRTFLSGVRAVPEATRVRVTRGYVSDGTYWPAAERWARVPEEDAYARAEDALLSSLERRTAEAGHVSLGLTAGLDSRVVAVALKLLGHPYETHTWGADGHPDVPGAKAVAHHLRVPHRRLSQGAMLEDEVFASLDCEARWRDGHASAGFIKNEWPRDLHGARIVTGHGGTAKAVYYRSHAFRSPASDRRSVHRAMAFDAPLAGARRDVRRLFEARVAGWVEEAESLGYRGWRSLDVLYALQRGRHWVRASLPREPEAVVAAFATPEVASSLASQPLTERLNTGFHCRFLQKHCPGLGSQGPPPPATVSPARARLALLARPLRRRLRRGVRSDPTWLAIGLRDRPRLRSWIAEEVLRSTLVEEGLGRGWSRRVRSEFLQGDPRATRLALQVAGPVALVAALADAAR